jgi:drug/metabolite transporter (DMT)-like permease
VTLLAGWLLDERITLPRWGFAAAGFVGMLLIVRPGTGILDSASFFALAAAAAYAVYQILTRKLVGEDLRVLLFYPCLCGAVLMSIVIAFEPDDVWYPTSDLALFLGIGVMGSIWALAVHAGVPARVGVGDRAVHLCAAGVLDDRSLGAVRDVPRRLGVDGNGSDRRQRRRSDLVRAAGARAWRRRSPPQSTERFPIG